MLRVLELYSGIGGMHCALQESGLPFEVVWAIDINSTANKVYRYAFPQAKLSECGIETLTVKQLDDLRIDMIVMSPPCQPFTRVGKKMDTEDLRTKSFLHILSLLPKLSHCPRYILVENVKGFEGSQTRDALLDTLQTCGFDFQECLLTPLQFGIPNSRLRYFLIAKRSPAKFTFKTSTNILDKVPSFAERWLSYKAKKRGRKHGPSGSDMEAGKDITASANSTASHNPCGSEATGDDSNHQENSSSASLESIDDASSGVDCGDSDCCDDKFKTLLEFGHNMRQIEGDECSWSGECLCLGSFLEKQSPEYFDRFRLPDKELKRFIVMDIVHPCLTKTICFTKRYGHFMEGAGSIVQMTTDVEVVKRASEFKHRAVELQNRDKWGEEEIAIIKALQLRYFTPTEIKNLLCFPQTFDFPEDLSRIQAYRLLGNSLNVHVVSVLLRILVDGDFQAKTVS